MEVLLVVESELLVPRILMLAAALDLCSVELQLENRQTPARIKPLQKSFLVKKLKLASKKACSVVNSNQQTPYLVDPLLLEAVVSSVAKRRLSRQTACSTTPSSMLRSKEVSLAEVRKSTILHLRRTKLRKDRYLDKIPRLLLKVEACLAGLQVVEACSAVDRQNRKPVVASLVGLQNRNPASLEASAAGNRRKAHRSSAVEVASSTRAKATSGPR